MGGAVMPTTLYDWFYLFLVPLMAAHWAGMALGGWIVESRFIPLVKVVLMVLIWLPAVMCMLLVAAVLACPLVFVTPVWWVALWVGMRWWEARG